MNHIMDLLRGPALGVIFMVFLMAGVILITASAALVAQVGLMLRLKPWNAPQQGGHQRGPDQPDRMAAERRDAGNVHERASSTSDQPSPRVAVTEQDTGDVIDADWWQEVR